MANFYWRIVLWACAILGASSVAACNCYGPVTATTECKTDSDCRTYGANWVCERAEPGVPYCRPKPGDAGQ